MMKFVSFLLVAALHAGAISADSSGNRNCPGGHAQGSQIDVGRYWYECKDGQMVPKGCLAEDGHRVDVGSTFDTNDNRMQCVLGSDGYLTVIYKACVYRGGEHDVGSQWDDGTSVYACVKEGSNVRVTLLGCVDQGRPTKLDERVVKGDFIYQCKKSSDGTPKMDKVGCVQDGRKYNIGETYEGPTFWYTCTDSGSKVVGCMYQSHRMQDGDHFTRDNMMYRCKVSSDSADLVPFACLALENGAMIERRVGCQWTEGDYEYTCLAFNDNKVIRAQTQCYYRSSQGGYFKVQPGCVQLADNIAVGCKQVGEGLLRTETYPGDQVDRVPGLRRC